MDTLKLVLTNKWFDAHVDGSKRIEYRRMCAFWKTRIWDKRYELKNVRFQRAFNPPVKFAWFEIIKIDIGSCPIDGWGGNYYRVHFKEVKNASIR